MEDNQSQVGLGQNTTTSQIQTQPPILQSQALQQPPQQQGTPLPTKSSMKNTFLLIIVLVVAVIFLLIVYFSLANRQPNVLNTPTYPAITTIPTQTEAQEIDSIDIGDIDADLKEIDTDLQGL